MMENVIIGLARAEGFVTALGAVASDREGLDGKPCHITRETKDAVNAIANGISFINHNREVIKELEEENNNLADENRKFVEQIAQYEEEIKRMREDLRLLREKAGSGAFGNDSICDCWHDMGVRKECWGTKERPVCSCGGDKNKCDFYGG